MVKFGVIRNFNEIWSVYKTVENFDPMIKNSKFVSVYMIAVLFLNNVESLNSA